MDVHLVPDSPLKELLAKQEKEKPPETLGTEATDDIKVGATEVETPEAPAEQPPTEEPKVENSSTESKD